MLGSWNMLDLKKISVPTWCALAVTLLSAWLLIRPHLSPLDIPYGDGRGFAARAIQLHGLLHSGQWSAFWEQVLTPTTFTLLPTYVLFWLVPTTGATGVTYGVVHTLAWHALLLLGVWGLLRELGLARLLPAVLLLTLANNYALDCTLYYYMDMSFAACALVALWWWARACLRQTRGAALAAGATAGALLFVKPGNAFTFLPCYAVATVALVGLWWWRLPRAERGLWVRKVAAGVGLWLAAFLPVLLLACGWTLIPNIVDRLLGQSSDYWAAAKETSPNPVLRWFYFPLCLSYFYSLLVLGLGGLIAILLFRWWPALKREPPLVVGQPERRVLAGMALGFLLFWGLVFAVIMQVKMTRGLTPMVPVLWICVLGWLALRWRLARTVTVLAALYFLVAHAQFAWGVAGHKQNRDTQSYVLQGDWLHRLPSQAPEAGAGASFTHHLLGMLTETGVTGGRVAVGTEMLYWNACSLNWVTQIPSWQQGRQAPFEFTTAADHQGSPVISGLTGAAALMLVVHPAVQYSREVFEFNARTAQYAMQKWDGTVARRVATFALGDGQPAVVLVVFRQPLDEATLKEYLQAHFPGRRADQLEGENFLLERRLPWKEYWRILRESRGGLKVDVIRPGVEKK